VQWALRSVRAAAPSAAAALAVIACHHTAPPRAGSAPEPTLAESRALRSESMILATDALAVYRRAGFLVSSGEVPFIGSLGYLAGPTPDSTIVVVAFSISNHALSFTREGDQYRAAYDVILEFHRDTTLIARVHAHEEVRVGSFKETTREEESVIFQQLVSLAPGAVAVTISTRDAGSTRIGTAQMQVYVPRLDAGSISTPIPVFRARARPTSAVRPQVIVSPRATAIFGRDSVAEFYVERYGPTADARGAALEAKVLDDAGHAIFADTQPLRPSGDMVRSAVLRVPVGRIGFGVLYLSVSDVVDGARGARIASRVPLLVTFGDGFAVSSFEQMLGYLRFFATTERLQALRDTAPQDRAKAWAAFLQATDPLPSTVENEALRDYFARLAHANMRFREEGVPGWLTDRGMIYSALGEPDDIMEPTGSDPMQRDRVQVWEYQRYRVRFIFVDQAGFGRWRLTPSSEAEYHALMRRLSR
jgi:GWxTD domain-containing protein